MFKPIGINKLKFNNSGLIPAIIQDYKKKDVLMLGYMNKEALEKTLASGVIHFFSRKRNRLWKKGETSGNYQIVKEAYYDCDADTLLFCVEQRGVACHTGNISCFFSKLTQSQNIFEELTLILKDRKKNKEELKDKSYSAKLFSLGKANIAKKLGEEAIELILAAKKNKKEEIINEAADLIFHILILLTAYNLNLVDVEEELYRRRR